MENSNRKGPIVARGHVRTGVVVSDRSKKTVIVEYDTLESFPKYKRFARSKSRLPVHNPESIGAKLGDEVEVAECRKISKTKAWIVTRIIKQAAGKVVLDRKGGRALEEEAERLKKAEVKRD
ncbi:TPA: 30S ribosomal protein S17 [Candidatus Micrarchaeota archaeon]|nr:30S ribosomal protein S17 [Candidatus Micrarchaeota archaeon]HIH29828.1 30S ribosomal protein S17 [Candidatus Micrarchaeota archaeon]